MTLGGFNGKLYADGRFVGDVSEWRLMTNTYGSAGCGNPNCKNCRQSLTASAYVDGWAQQKKEAKMPDTGTQGAIDQINAVIDGRVKAKQQEVDTLNAQILDITTKRNKIAKEIGALKSAKIVVSDTLQKVEETPKPRGEFFYYGSRTGTTDGHYIEKYRDGTTRCSCPAGAFGRICWAQERAKSAYGNRYNMLTYYTPTQFDRIFDAQVAKSKSR